MVSKPTEEQKVILEAQFKKKHEQKEEVKETIEETFQMHITPIHQVCRNPLLIMFRVSRKFLY